MSDLLALYEALTYNTKALAEYNGNASGYIELLTQRNNILTMMLQAKQEEYSLRKIA